MLFPNTKRYYMSTSVTFVYETPFFSSSMEDANIFRWVLPISLVEPFVYPIPNTVTISLNYSNSSH